MNFQGSDYAVLGVDQQATLLDILKEKEKVYTKKMEEEMIVIFSNTDRSNFTINQLKMLEISRELDRSYRI